MTIRAILALGAAIAAVPILALAQGTAPAVQAPIRIDEVCKTELTSLCASTADKRGPGLRCLVDNKAKLGADCAKAVEIVAQRRAALETACRADADKLCGSQAKAGDKAKPGDKAKGPIQVACLRAKTAELSKPCADLVATLPQGGKAK